VKAGLVLVLLVGCCAFGLAKAPVAYASCPQNDDQGIFTESSDGGNNNSHGDQADVLVKAPPLGDCATATGLVGEGTAHMHVGASGSGDFAEIGWVEFHSPRTGNQPQLFWEVSFNGQGASAHLFDSGCENVGTTSTFRVGNKSGTTQWAMSYACNGGGFTQIALSQALGESTGDSRGEVTHHSSPIPTNGLDDHFTNLQWRNASAVWNLWGGVTCQDPQAGFHVNVISGHEFAVGDGSGFCSS
jgi:hypothetical protein